MGIMVGFGVLGFIFRKLDWPLAPTVLALILGPMMERTLRTSLEMSAGDLSILVTRPISAFCSIVAAIVLISPGFACWGKKPARMTGADRR